MSLLSALPFDPASFCFVEAQPPASDFLSMLMSEVPEEREPEPELEEREPAKLLPFVFVIPREVPPPPPRLYFGTDTDVEVEVEVERGTAAAAAPEAKEPAPERPAPAPSRVAFRVSLDAPVTPEARVAPEARAPEVNEAAEKVDAPERVERTEPKQREEPEPTKRPEPKRREQEPVPPAEHRFHNEMKTTGERRSAPAPMARAAPVAAEHAEPAKAAVVREIAIRLPGAESRPVDVHLVDRGGKVQVEVLTDDSRLAGSLRDNVGDLVDRLRSSGYSARTETVRPPDDTGTPGVAAAAERVEAPDAKSPLTKDHSQGQGGDAQGGQGQQQGHHRGNRSRWIEEMLRNGQTHPERQEEEDHVDY